MKWLVEKAFPEAKKIRLVMDNLAMHAREALYERFEPCVRQFDLGSVYHLILLANSLKPVKNRRNISSNKYSKEEITMSLRPQTVPFVPEETARVARAAFPKGNLYMQLRDEIGVLFDDADFADLFPTRGQPAYAPWRLALITIFQFIENLSDRAASDAVRARIDWKYALSLELEDSGFDSTASVRVSRPAGYEER